MRKGGWCQCFKAVPSKNWRIPFPSSVKVRTCYGINLGGEREKKKRRAFLYIYIFLFNFFLGL